MDYSHVHEKTRQSENEWLESSHQFLHGLNPRVDEELGPTAQIRNGDLVHVQPHSMIQSRMNLTESGGSRIGLATQSVGGSDHLPMPEAASRQERKTYPRPVITAAILVNGRSPPELSSD
jgi:hypothetical protein